MPDCSNYSCINSEEKGQKFPQKNGGDLSKNMDRQRTDLIDELKKHLEDIVYSYVVDTIEEDSIKNFIQKGSAPNFQGGHITLCSCKHFMRTFKVFEKIKNETRSIWITGICSVKLDNALFYLMKVSDSYESQYDIWKSLSEDTRQAKNARVSKFGDLYEPVEPWDNANKYDIKGYEKPREDHVHKKENSNEWKQDIEYKNKRLNRYPVMIIGDPDYSFLWSTPKIMLKHPKAKKFVCGQKKWKLEEFLNCLKDV